MEWRLEAAMVGKDVFPAVVLRLVPLVRLLSRKREPRMNADEDFFIGGQVSLPVMGPRASSLRHLTLSSETRDRQGCLSS